MTLCFFGTVGGFKCMLTIFAIFGKGTVVGGVSEATTVSLSGLDRQI